MTLGVSGSLCTLRIEGSLLAESETFTFTANQATIDLTNRDSGWWSEFIAGMRDWEISGEGLYIYNDLAKRKLQRHLMHRVPTHLHVILTLSGANETFTGVCILTTLSYPGPHADKGSISFTLKGTGALTPSPLS